MRRWEAGKLGGEEVGRMGASEVGKRGGGEARRFGECKAKDEGRWMKKKGYKTSPDIQRSKTSL